MVTKQQQLEYLARECHSWRGRDFILVSDTELGYRLPVSSGCHLITKKEWQQERDKIGSKPVVDNSWHERGELPHVGGVCEAMINGEWIAAEVLRHRINSAGMNVAAVMSCASFGVYWAADFRPLRTEREKAIDEMLLAIDHIKEGNFETFIGALYDAGYRKVKP